jgi:hypothetical protein
MSTASDKKSTAARNNVRLKSTRAGFQNSLKEFDAAAKFLEDQADAFEARVKASRERAVQLRRTAALLRKSERRPRLPGEPVVHKSGRDAFSKYYNSELTKALAEGEKLDVGPRSQRVAQKWKELSDAEKAKFEDAASETREKHAVWMKEYEDAQAAELKAEEDAKAARRAAAKEARRQRAKDKANDATAAEVPAEPVSAEA